ncbi:MAG TPA: immunoglobulin domain-containing protein, partial [Verrucomicrobiae bacterium]|nr:immunoglobulin domain-containing protein [Verrucomicrobiae bacterium]
SQISAGRSFLLALAGDSAPCISLPPRGRTILPGISVNLGCTAAGTPPLAYQWQHNGGDISDATNSTLWVTNFVSVDVGDYRVVVTNRHGKVTSPAAVLTAGPIIAWGNNSSEQIWIPAGVTNPIQVAGGDSYSAALDAEGAPIQWGGRFGLEMIPTNLGRCTAISAGFGFTLALLENGTVAAWGANFNGETNVPPGLTNVVAVSANNGFSLALLADGRVATWGDPFLVQSNVVAGLSDVVAISAGGFHSLALKADGTVFAWGRNAGAATNVPADVADVVAIAASFGYSVALKADGTVAVWGTSNPSVTNPPAGLSDVVAIGAGFNGGRLALRSDGSLVAWGPNQYGESNIPPGVNNVIRIASGWSHHLAIVGDGKPAITGHVPRRSVRAGGTLRLAALAAGAQPLRYRWQLNGVDIAGATNATLTVSGMTAAEAGSYRCIVSNDLGSITGPITTVTVISEPLYFDTSVDGLHYTNSVIHLRLTNLSGVGPVTIYASTNLADWEGIHTNAPVAGTLDFTDLTATNHAARYYRAVEGPQP